SISAAHLDLHSFPTRRSSDLIRPLTQERAHLLRVLSFRSVDEPENLVLGGCADHHEQRKQERAQDAWSIAAVWHLDRSVYRKPLIQAENSERAMSAGELCSRTFWNFDQMKGPS